MLTFGSKLSDDNEYFLVFGGQSNSRPWGSNTDGFSAAPEMKIGTTGSLNGGLIGSIQIPHASRTGTGVTLTLPESLPTGAFHGAQLRLYDPEDYVTGAATGNAWTQPIGGYATIRVNTTSTMTIDWVVSMPSAGVTFAGNVATSATAHGLQNGTRVHFDVTGGSLPTSGTGNIDTVTTYYVKNRTPTTFELARTRGGATIVLTSAGSGTMTWFYGPAGTAVFDGYITRTDGKWLSYPGVRVLTPYQPEGPDTASTNVPYPAAGTEEALKLPGIGTVASSITSFSQLCALLPLTDKEGVDSHGISEATDTYATPSAHPWDDAATDGTHFGWTNTSGAGPPINSLAGGYLRVQWISGGVAKLSWATITTNTPTQATVVWAGDGDGDPSGGSSVKFEAWIPHYNSNPHSFLPGKGFRYPNNDMQPCFSGGLIVDHRIHNRPRGITTNSYGTDKFGTLRRFAWMLSVALGKRINVILLGVNSSAQAWTKEFLGFGFNGSIGWYDYNNVLDWTPGDSVGLAARLKTLITNTQAAVTAEGLGKTAKVLGIGWLQGEGDALMKGGRLRFAESLSTFKQWLRKTIDDAGMNPYASGAKIPFVQAQIMHTPYELTGNVAYYGTTINIDGDADGLVNEAIITQAALDGFSDTTYIDDQPRLNAGTPQEDLGHLSGVGEAEHGKLLADAMIPLIERALAFGGAAIRDSSPVTICNLALSHLGDAGRITSIEPVDGSAQSALCAKHYNTALRTLLEMRPWSFATRRIELLALPESPSTSWDYAYGLPGDCVNAIAVLPPGAGDDYSGSAAPSGDTVVTKFGQIFQPLPLGGGYQPVKFAVETYQGARILLTDQEDAVLRYTAMVCDQRTPMFDLCLSYHVASLIAGSLIKGEAGAAMAARCTQMANYLLARAETTDANQRKERPEHHVPWLDARS